MTSSINQFQGNYRFLSNFWPCNITVVGVTYKNVEAAYQASKTTDMRMRREFSDLNPRDAKARGKKIPLRASWGDVLKVECMENCLRAKFAIPELRELLLATGDAELTEGNNWNDTFWGVCRGKGRNVLGKLLMGLRDELAQYVEPDLNEVTRHLHVYKGEVYDDRDDYPRTFNNYDDIPF